MSQTKTPKALVEQETSTTFTIVKRDGTMVPFNGARIFRSIEMAFRDVRGFEKEGAIPEDIVSMVKVLGDQVISKVLSAAAKGACVTVDGIQDLTEVTLMEAGHHDVARGYIVYREQHKTVREDSPLTFKVLRRQGTEARLNPMKIASALERGFRDTYKIEEQTPTDVLDAVNFLTSAVVEGSLALADENKTVSIETIQDVIEKTLMAESYYDVAKDFILYRARHQEEREQKAKEEVVVEEKPKKKGKRFTVTLEDGSTKEVSERELRAPIEFACRGFEKLASADDIYSDSVRNFYEGVKVSDIEKSHIMASRAKIELDPAYAFVTARLLLNKLYQETMGVTASDKKLKGRHNKYFEECLRTGIEVDRMSSKLLDFDLKKLAETMDLSRDLQFTYLGLQTLYDRYFIHHQERRLETPQIFWMRVAMGLAINEGEKKNERAIEFYNVLSQFLFTSSTPTLFNSGTCHSQLSSCYLSTINDDLIHIFKVVSDNARLSKWAGGIGNDWTNVRSTGARIHGTNGQSQGIVPFLKVANDTAVAVNQGGKRQGATCAYLETWHMDIEDFIELRKNTGDERRRTHDMNTANWIPDLFMKRVANNEHWTLFSPDLVPDLHDLYGKAFEKRYVEYEKMADSGEIKHFKRMEAVALWRKMLSMLFETGHPWMTFKDPSNIRSPQDHCGVVHSSNLCTEILLNTSAEETAVCNLGSINLAAHTTKNGIDQKLLANTIRTAIRMLDNVIDINFYPIPEAQTTNQKHRPIGMGYMGFQDALYIQGISYASPEAVDFADSSMEIISYHAILASSELAKERGRYSSYEGSKWDRGLLPIDTIELVKEERGAEYLDMDTSAKLDWKPVREHIKEHGMRNSNTMAIAPTATISNMPAITQSV